MMNYALVEQQRPSESLVLGLAVYLLLWIAIFNGYPTVYDDTGGYLDVSFTPYQQPYRSIIYGFFIRLASWGISPWLIVLAQCAITIYVLRAVFEYIVQKHVAINSERYFFLGLVAFLAFATSLPWFVGQLMPDVFAALAFLSAFLLLYDPTLSFERTILLSGVLAVSVGSHLSNFISLGIVLSAVLVFRAFRKTRQIWPVSSPKRIAAFVLAPILASAAVVIECNHHAGYGFTLSAGTPVFLFNRLLENRLADGYLEEQCKIEQLTPCKYLQDLPRLTFLWGPHPLLAEMGGWLGARGEASRIVFGTVRRYPIRFLVECVKQMFRQFITFKPGVDNYPYNSGPTVDALDRLYPGDIEKFRLTRQWSGQLKSIGERISSYYEFNFWTSLLASVMLLLKRYSQSPVANRFFLLTLIFLFANALVTASVSLVSDRYQSRVCWLVSLCFAAYLLPLILDWRQKRLESYIPDDYRAAGRRL
jgi:hypothetical protein